MTSDIGVVSVNMKITNLTESQVQALRRGIEEIGGTITEIDIDAVARDREAAGKAKQILTDYVVSSEFDPMAAEMAFAAMECLRNLAMKDVAKENVAMLRLSAREKSSQ